MKTKSPSLLLPAPVGALLSRLPGYPGSLLLATALNTVLAPRLPADTLHYLQNRRLRIHVRDARLTFDLMWSGQRFVPGRWGEQTDLTIAAAAHDFLKLARRQEDPDTLFFDRRLSMEGDTELGLVVKNALDGLELPVFDPRQLRPDAVLARVRATVRGRS
jgi:predicted lipid carrier protein YhbT